MAAAAMNPCKCGFYPIWAAVPVMETQIRRYLSRISLLLDRIDIGVDVPRQAQPFVPGKKRESHPLP